MLLRKDILHMSKHQEELPETLSAESLHRGQGHIPETLHQFFTVLYTGSDQQPDIEKMKRLEQSVSQDVIYATTRGRTKPGKHLTLGLGLKSMTGSRKVIEVLNRHGHCIGYHTAEIIETDLATQIVNRQNVTPDGLLQHSGLCTFLAWDNYDERTETLSGLGTLHDTVGICYQNETDLSPATNALANDSVDSSELRIPAQIIPETYKSRRSLKLQQPILEPYRKKPRITVFKYTVTDIPRPPKLTTVERRDLFWMINVATSPETPMWVGWNSQMTDDPLPKQKIAYMENLTLPITRLDVVAETLRVTQQVAQECGQEYGVVHYDLNAAKPALQIQSTEAPKYDNLFICFGPFHIMMSYFGSVGYLIDSSGGPEILVDADVLASGSLTGFLKGKHFNRCKRLHLLFATALQVLQ